ncbi:MAG TPA: 5-(carboxyamino)imidazole ribonucleotide synthase [Alphaproteobacteria bacterium]|nr:5-(carboxyamino)imidazole ribonucleotide synthase [Alphaproteobacteria bacterium]
MDPLAPGAAIGILGGGQLGRMLAMAAARLGYRAHIYCPEQDSPAAQVAAKATVAEYGDEAALDAFAGSIGAATFEFENIPAAATERLAQAGRLRPGVLSLTETQDRLREKNFVRKAGAATVAYAAVETAADIGRALAATGTPAILKARRFGYDGKGQVRIADGNAGSEGERAFETLGRVPCILEAVSAFACEISVVLARGADGRTAVFDVAENVHRNGILHSSTVPARIGAATEAAARQVAESIAEALGHIGVLAVEFFVVNDGSFLVNEVAPRVHNSGHWTLDGCLTDQFEQHIRAVAGLPLGDPHRHSDAVMTNLIGNDVDGWETLAAEPGAKLHFYGKGETRPGRKMGHVTRLSPRS